MALVQSPREHSESRHIWDTFGYSPSTGTVLLLVIRDHADPEATIVDLVNSHNV